MLPSTLYKKIDAALSKIFDSKNALKDLVKLESEYRDLLDKDIPALGYLLSAKALLSGAAGEHAQELRLLEKCIELRHQAKFSDYCLATLTLAYVRCYRRVKGGKIGVFLILEDKSLWQSVGNEPVSVLILKELYKFPPVRSSPRLAWLFSLQCQKYECPTMRISRNTIEGLVRRYHEKYFKIGRHNS